MGDNAGFVDQRLQTGYVGGLVGPDPQYTDDMTVAAASVRKLATLPVKTILPGHGDPLTSGAAEALGKLAASLKG